MKEQLRQKLKEMNYDCLGDEIWKDALRSESTSQHFFNMQKLQGNYKSIYNDLNKFEEICLWLRLASLGLPKLIDVLNSFDINYEVFLNYKKQVLEISFNDIKFIFYSDEIFLMQYKQNENVISTLDDDEFLIKYTGRLEHNLLSINAQMRLLKQDNSLLKICGYNYKSDTFKALEEFYNENFSIIL